MQWMNITRISALLTGIFLLPAFALADNNITSLQSSVTYALEHNRSLSATSSQVDAAQAQVDNATAVLYPRLDVSTGFYRSNNPLNVFGTLVSQERVAATDLSPTAINNPSYLNNYQSRLGLTMPLYAGGANYATNDRASANAEAAEFELHFQTQSLIYQTIIVYTQTRQTEAQLEAQEGAVAAAEQSLDDAKALQKRGMAIQSDVMDAKVYVLRNQLALEEIKNQRANSFESLRFVLGMPNTMPLGALAEPIIKTNAHSLDELLSLSLENRADLAALDQQALAAEASRAQAQSGYMPHLNLTATREWNNDTLGLQNGNNTLGLTFSMNLFSGGADRANIHAAESASLSIELQQQDKRQQVQNEVRQAWRGLQLAEKKLKSESESYKQTQESLRIKSLRHHQGLETTSELLSSQVRKDQAHVAKIRANYDVIIAKAALLLAAGILTTEVVQ